MLGSINSRYTNVCARLGVILNINYLVSRDKRDDVSRDDENNEKKKFDKIAVAQAKPLDFPLDESINEIDHGTNLRESPLERQLSPALPTNQQPTAATVPVGAINPAAGSAIATTVRAVSRFIDRHSRL